LTNDKIALQTISIVYIEGVDELQIECNAG